MGQRRIWKQDEDRILKIIYQDQGIKKWSKICKIMSSVYGIMGRDGKQCRDRYHNHLKCGINKDKWSLEEENLLITLHGQFGNKWALISRHIKGRTESFVKNMLYSKLRRSIRELNQFSYMFYRRQLKQIKMPLIYKLVQFTESALKKKQHERNHQDLLALDLKHQILTVSYNLNQQLDSQEILRIKTLIENINFFKKIYLHFKGYNWANKFKLKQTPHKIQNHDPTLEKDKQDVTMNQQPQNNNFISPNSPKYTIDASITLTASPTKPQSEAKPTLIDNTQNQAPLFCDNHLLQYPIMVQNFDSCWNHNMEASNNIIEDWSVGIASWKTFAGCD